MQFKITTIYYLLVAVVSIIPFPWWYYSVGGIVTIEDSPFQALIYFMGTRLILSDVITFLLTAFRLYVFILAIGYAFQSMRGNPKIYSTMFWFPVLYVLDPILIYVLFKFIPQLLGVPIQYPFFIWGTETFTSTYKGDQIVAEVVSYPTPVYWFALGTAVLYPFSRWEIRSSRGRARQP
ncbi:hypothetical protein L3N51_01210 [Metallosphaera sp. J1]|uniref:hypothetical protein n=1 Tax=Metallosphaera javensis (ex Hofmann et al. 2022) TaxID=99938 RepID=UPI001EE00A7F|nr:hypothetical protein [Metallosphaera javensis (ex Hofmann et al. 2022)]MCG3108920.1 hypothetical protein [Metallosphaera javensis (ex Hofmann et al. 2022)]